MANQTKWQTSTLEHAEHSVSKVLKSCMGDLIYIYSTKAGTAMKNAVNATRVGCHIAHAAKQLTANPQIEPKGIRPPPVL